MNLPSHVFPGQWKQPDVVGAAASGVNLVYFTVDTEEHATRFIKDVFRKGFVNSVQMFDSNFERSYLKLGQPTTEKSRVRLEMVVPAGNVGSLISWVNNNNPVQYDYPVADLTVLDVTGGNSEYVNWAKTAHSIDYSKLQ